MVPNVVPAVPWLPIEEDETDAAAPVEDTDADAPLPDIAPVKRLPVFTTSAPPVRVELGVCVILPTVVPKALVPLLPIEATETDAVAPVAPHR